MRMQNIINEYTRECLTILFESQIDSAEVLYNLCELFIILIIHGISEHIRSDNGTEFTA